MRGLLAGHDLIFRVNIITFPGNTVSVLRPGKTRNRPTNWSRKELQEGRAGISNVEAASTCVSYFIFTTTVHCILPRVL